MNFLKALTIGIVAYLGMVLAVLFVPVVAILGLWIGLCVLSSVFLFAFWIFFTHSQHTLYSSLYMLAWGAPPVVAATVLGYWVAHLKAARDVPMASLTRDAPFQE